jgi:hypothetical protein
MSGINPGDELSKRLNVGTYTRRVSLASEFAAIPRKNLTEGSSLLKYDSMSAGK